MALTKTPIFQIMNPQKEPGMSQLQRSKGMNYDNKQAVTKEPETPVIAPTLPSAESDDGPATRQAIVTSPGGFMFRITAPNCKLNRADFESHCEAIKSNIGINRTATLPAGWTIERV